MRVVVTEGFIEQHTLKCLSWLLRYGRVKIKVALMKEALFHLKVWLFRADDDVISAHGSSNMTYAGIQKNIEQLSIARSWEDQEQSYTTEKFSEQFERLWKNQDKNCIVVPMPEAICHSLLHSYPADSPPTESDLRKLYARATESLKEAPRPYETLKFNHQSFAIPSNLRYDEGPYEHQGRAVDAWWRGRLCRRLGNGNRLRQNYHSHDLCSPTLRCP